MIFTSTTFLLFFAAVYAVYRALPRRGQNVALLLASYAYYAAWDWRYLGLIALSTAIDYVAGLRIERSRGAGRRSAARAWLTGSVLVNLSVLGAFKACDFFAPGFARLAAGLGLPVSPEAIACVLPIGLSFYTLQTIGYSIDVYRRRVPACRDPLDFALFVGFFPQLLAGPIERAGRLIPQLQSPRRLERAGLAEGGWLLFWGVFKKVFIADNLFPHVRLGLEQAPALDALGVYVLCVSFAIQVYCDFSGYTDIARGLARLLGIELMNNFDRPFFARDPADLWRRWHVSLTSWLRDYAYLPLRRALVRAGVLRELAIAISTVATFAVMGLWHGTTWGWVAWGVFWGLALVVQRRLERAGLRPGPALSSAAGPVVVFHLFAFALLLTPLEPAVAAGALGRLAELTAGPESRAQLAILLYFAWPLVAVEGLAAALGPRVEWVRAPFVIRFAAALVGTLMLAGSGAVRGEEFLYFRF